MANHLLDFGTMIQNITTEEPEEQTLGPGTFKIDGVDFKSKILCVDQYFFGGLMLRGKGINVSSAGNLSFTFVGAIDENHFEVLPEGLNKSIVMLGTNNIAGLQDISTTFFRFWKLLAIATTDAFGVEGIQVDWLLKERK